MAIPAKLSLIFDVVHASRPAYMLLSGSERARLQGLLLETLFGAANVQAAKVLFAQAAWNPAALETEVDPVTDLQTGRIAHPIARVAMEAAVATLTPLLQKGRRFAREAEHDHDHDDAMAAFDGPHCIRWILVDGQWKAEYNYSLVLVEPDPASPNGERRSSYVRLTDHLGTLNQVEARMHVALRYDLL